MKKTDLFTNLSPVKGLVSRLLVTVLGLLCGFSAHAQNQTLNQTTNKMKLQKSVSVESDYVFTALTLVSRSTSLVDHKDGTRTDSIDYGFMPVLKMPVGSISSRIIYSQNLNDQSPSESDFSDIPVTFAFNSFKTKAFKDAAIRLTPTITAIAPVSKTSVKKDQLQTALISGLSFGFIPSVTNFNSGYGWSLGASISFGRNFHAYEEDINGSVLNQYSSNQTLNALYKYRNWRINVEFNHLNRWSYQNNLKEAFEHSEEVAYDFTANFSLALGHTNAGSALKANGVDSNYNLINENDSKVYGQIAVSF